MLFNKYPTYSLFYFNRLVNFQKVHWEQSLYKISQVSVKFNQRVRFSNEDPL